jgi:hypothetical protein
MQFKKRPFWFGGGGGMIATYTKKQGAFSETMITYSLVDEDREVPLEQRILIQNISIHLPD